MMTAMRNIFENCRLLKYDAVQCNRNLRTCRRNIILPFREQRSLWVPTRLHGVALYKTGLFTVRAVSILNSLAYNFQRCEVLASSRKDSEILPVHKYFFLHFAKYLIRQFFHNVFLKLELH